MYNFDDLEEKDLRENHRIVRCCGNCKYYWYFAGNQRKGNCTINDVKARTPIKSKIVKTDKKNREIWPTTHVTCVCDKHQMQSRVTSMAKVTDYCGAKFNERD
ncbi:MAG: hypothetical protein H8E12_14810 [Rhodobacteraceae bacterium]|nr:hypothetical protein [Paracoccaceae bacterium]